MAERIKRRIPRETPTPTDVVGSVVSGSNVVGSNVAEEEKFNQSINRRGG